MANSLNSGQLCTRQKIMDTALLILSTEQEEQFTFAYIAKKANLSRSGIVSYFPKKTDLELALKPQILELVEEQLDFSTLESFIESWKALIDGCGAVATLLINSKRIIQREEGISRLFTKVNGHPSEVESAIYFAIGYAFINLASHQEQAE